jgi:1,2-dihydroxy-3-keto-5-methylthiopentene dioxygenase
MIFITMLAFAADTPLPNTTAIEAALTPLGVTFGAWPLAEWLGENLTPQALLAQSVESTLTALDAPIAAWKAEAGYESHDMVSLTPATANLAELLAMFDKPHHHTDDEVRLTLAGSGIFTIYPTPEHPGIKLIVEAGDWIVIPAGVMHDFTLTDVQEIVALRLFKTNPQWQAHYQWPAVETLSTASASVSSLPLRP